MFIMKETLQDLKTRRSCRKYLDKQISESELDAVLEAGTYAPTGMGRQSPKMVVLQKKEDIKYLSQLNASIMGADTDPFYGAPTVVVVFADKNIRTYYDDGVLVMDNLLNAAHAVGVDSCFIYRAREVFNTQEGKALMKKWGIGEEYEGIGNCILGYGAPDGIKPAAERKSDYIIKI